MDTDKTNHQCGKIDSTEVRDMPTPAKPGNTVTNRINIG